jgi:rubrerythrin
MFEIKEILDLSIRLEKNGEATYRKAIQSAVSEELKTQLAWMAAEEARHGEWFARLKADLSLGIKNPFMEEMSHQVFEDLVGGESFSLKEVDFALISDPLELVSIFVEFEKDTILFYELLAPFIEDGETRRHLEAIIAEENRHIERLQQFLKSGAVNLVPVR